jgi:hypothetical protein
MAMAGAVAVEKEFLYPANSALKSAADLDGRAIVKAIVADNFFHSSFLLRSTDASWWSFFVY